MKRRPLQWGLKEDSFQKRFPNVSLYVEKNSVIYKRLVITPFPSDCGALILTGANYATKESLTMILKVASACGFNKIFATVVGSPLGVSEQVAAFKSKRFKLVFEGYSNRKNDGYTKDYVFVKYIRNCEWKGYGWNRG